MQMWIHLCVWFSSEILSEGDEIVEINGQSIRKQFSEDALRSLLNDISGDIVIKVKSNNHGANYTNQHEHDNTTINSPDHVRHQIPPPPTQYYPTHTHH